jgi:hypothetical protein
MVSALTPARVQHYQVLLPPPLLLLLLLLIWAIFGLHRQQ